MFRQREEFRNRIFIHQTGSDLLHEEMWVCCCKSRDLMANGRPLVKLLDRALPDEKLNEWGWNFSRKERAAIKWRERKNLEDVKRIRREIFRNARR